MRTRMLRSVLVAAFSAVLAMGAVSGLAGGGSDFKTADSTWGMTTSTVAVYDSSAEPGSSGEDDSTWG
ncbi:hypothetical protein GCM10018772_11000 [Streptomyces fumanus]|uniref:Secreted protein n=1 Tax=Streptomyces fumanus TaxID=67302 RepID=A0A919A6Z6_9ACTN|nr:hypothetical protein GCM10018772_11000 [Streptomyces fumanus]